MGQVIFDLAEVMARRRSQELKDELERTGARIRAQVAPAVMAVRINLAEERGRNEERKRWARRAMIWGIVCFSFVLAAFGVGWLVGALGG